MLLRILIIDIHMHFTKMASGSLIHRFARVEISSAVSGRRLFKHRPSLRSTRTPILFNYLVNCSASSISLPLFRHMLTTLHW